MALEDPISQEKRKILMPFGAPLSEPLATCFSTVLGTDQKADSISECDSLAASFQKWHILCWPDDNTSSCWLVVVQRMSRATGGRNVPTRGQCFEHLPHPVQGWPEVESTFDFLAALCAMQATDYCLCYLTLKYLQAIFFSPAEKTVFSLIPLFLICLSPTPHAPWTLSQICSYLLLKQCHFFTRNGWHKVIQLLFYFFFPGSMKYFSNSSIWLKVSIKDST